MSLFRKVIRTHCPYCGEKLKADWSYCHSCHHSLNLPPGATISGTQAGTGPRKPSAGKVEPAAVIFGKKDKKEKAPELPGRLKWIVGGLTPAGLILLFLFPPLGLLLLFFSSAVKRMLKNALRMPCPYCNEETIALFGAKNSKPFPCLHCKRKIKVDRSGDKPEFIQA